MTAPPNPALAPFALPTRSRFPATSRYAQVPTAQLARADGTAIPYLLRRFVPPPERFATVAEHVVIEGDRLDGIAARHLGDPEQFWRLCDANGALRPAELTDRVGLRIRITLPEGVPGAPRDPGA